MRADSVDPSKNETARNHSIHSRRVFQVVCTLLFQRGYVSTPPKTCWHIFKPVDLIVRNQNLAGTQLAFFGKAAGPAIQSQHPHLATAHWGLQHWLPWPESWISGMSDSAWKTRVSPVIGQPRYAAVTFKRWVAKKSLEKVHTYSKATGSCHPKHRGFLSKSIQQFSWWKALVTTAVVSGHNLCVKEVTRANTTWQSSCRAMCRLPKAVLTLPITCKSAHGHTGGRSWKPPAVRDNAETRPFPLFSLFFQSQIHPPTARFTEPTEPTQPKRESHPLDFSGPRAVSIALCGNSSARHVRLRGAPSPPGPASTDPARDRGF